MKETQMATTTPWPMVPFTDCLAPIKVRKTHKILARDYAKTGTIPIVDQGQELIAGWTNDDSSAINDQLPLVVFGDHTRIFKYVNFPFATGADGTQLLKPRNGFNPCFFYLACLNVDLPSRGYNRHFSVLKEKQLPKPLKPEQEKIAALLWKIQRAIEVEVKLTATARELKQSAMRQIIAHGLHGDALKETEIGQVPSSWNVCSIRTNAKLIAGGTPPRGEARYWNEGTIPWVKTGEMDYCVITDTEEKITQSGLENSAAKLLPSGTVLVAMYGQGITRGKVAILGIEAATNQACVGLIPKNDKVLPKYLYYYLTYSYERLRSLSHGAQQQNLNAELVGSFQVAFPNRDERPEKDEQLEIVRILSAIDHKIAFHERKHRTLGELFQTLLHKLMTGEIRVADLDIDVSEVTQ